jgi:hypothetical protein
VHRFDIDACEAFIEKDKDGKIVLGRTPEAVRAWDTRTAKFSAFKKTEGDLFRLTKLFQRGWTIDEDSWKLHSDEQIKAYAADRAVSPNKVGIEEIARMRPFSDSITDFVHGGSSHGELSW